MRSLAGFNCIIHQVEKDTAQITAFDIINGEQGLDRIREE